MRSLAIARSMLSQTHPHVVRHSVRDATRDARRRSKRRCKKNVSPRVRDGTKQVLGRVNHVHADDSLAVQTHILGVGDRPARVICGRVRCSRWPRQGRPFARRLRVRRVPIAGSRKPESRTRGVIDLCARVRRATRGCIPAPALGCCCCPLHQEGEGARKSVAQRVAHVRVRCRATVRDSHAGGFSRSGLRRPCAALRVRRMSPDPWTHFTFRSRRGKPDIIVR